MNLREYNELLLSPPPPLTIVQKLVALLVGILVGVSRPLSLSRTLWDWDEAQFCSAVRSYDVSLHHPHPPGYPLFVGSAKLLRHLMSSDFRSLQAVVFIAALLLFPVFFLLLRELRFAFAGALGGATLLSFVPTVWYHGGTAFSDVPALVLILSAAVVLLRSCRQPPLFLTGAALLGAALGFRPQSLIIGIVPLLLASRYAARRSLRLMISGGAICSAIVVASYGGAALASTSVPAFFDALHETTVWVGGVDSYRNPVRPPLPMLFAHFMIQPIGGGHQRNLIAALSLLSLMVSLVTRRIEVWMLVAMFVPTALFTWLMLDLNAATRYAIAYMPLYAALSVDGVLVLTAALGRFNRRLPATSAAAVVAILVGRSVWWTLPALRVARTSASPPASGMQWIREQVVPRRAPLYFHDSLYPFGDYFLGDYPLHRVRSERDIPETFSTTASYFIVEGASSSPQAIIFSRAHGRIWNIARQRYFEISILPLAESVRFEEGWYGQESSGGASWRWMGRRSRMLVAPIRGRVRLRLWLREPDALIPFDPNVQIIVNGATVADLRSTNGRIAGSWTLTARSTGPNEVIIQTDQVINPRRQHLGDDGRDLGLKLEELSWAAEIPSQP